MAKPDFMVEMHNVRKQILRTNEMAKRLNVHLEVGHSNELSKVMRAMNLVGAFARGDSVFSVESGNIDNRKFVGAMQTAINFMREYAEADTNRAFDDWVMDNLFADENSISIVDHRSRVLVM